MRGERGSAGYEVVYVVTEAQRASYAAAIAEATFKNARTGATEPVRVQTRASFRYGKPGFLIGVPTRAEWDAADIAVNRYITLTFTIGTRVRTLVDLMGNPDHPAGLLGEVTHTEGWASPMVTWDGIEGGPYHVGPQWLEVVAP